MFTRFRVLSTVLLLAVWGCASGEDSGIELGERWDSAGIEIVQHQMFGPVGQRTFQVGYLMEVLDTLPGILPLSMGGLALPDVINQAFVLFAGSGPHLDNLHWDIMEETIPEWLPWSGDTVLVIVSVEDSNAFVRRTLDGSWRDTLTVQPTPSQDPRTPDGRGPLFANHALWAASRHPDRFVLAQMAEPVVFLFEGKLLRRVIRWNPNRPSLGENAVDTVLRVVARGMDNRILSTLRAAGYGGPLWDVFSWSGDYLGVLDFGENVEVYRVRGDTVIGVREDSLGVQRPCLALLPPEITGEGPGS